VVLTVYNCHKSIVLEAILSKVALHRLSSVL